MLTDRLLLDYKRCQRKAYLNIHGDFNLKDPEKDFRLKLKQETERHVKTILEKFYPNYVQPHHLGSDWRQKAQATRELMIQGAECIYQGVIAREDYAVPLVGTPHLLIKQPGQSCFGNWYYIPISIQLGRRPKPEYKLVAAFYGYLLHDVQKTLPKVAEIILRRHNRHHIDVKKWRHKVQQNLANLLSTIASSSEPEVFISRQRCSLCQWYNHCYSIAQAEKHLSLVPGVTPSRYQQLKAMGVNTLASLAQISPISKSLEKEIATQLQQQALAMVENRPLVKISTYVSNLVSDTVEFYFDIEAEPERELDYLLGVLVVDHRSSTERFYPFLAESPEQEGEIWQEFLDLVNLHPHAPIFHYSEYEVETIKRLAQLYHTPREQQQAIVSRLVDLHRYVINSVIFPVESYSLKSLANWLGFKWRNPSASGEQSVYWYDQWLITRDRQLLELIVNYNEDDCRATRHLKDWLVDHFPRVI